MLKFVFEEQDYQKEAIESVVSLFSGMARDTQDYTHHTGIIGNRLTLSPEDLAKNLEQIQDTLIEKNQIDEKSDIDSQGMNFTIEMETGTGKTYVYIRTILELASTYGWRKYIIVVPSLPIKEWVLKTFQMTREHFRSLPDIAMYNEREYDSKKLQLLKDFARSDGVEILIITMGAINKDLNTINKYIDSFSEYVDSGKPVDMIAETRPIVILDEPQNMEWEQTRKGLEKLCPLFTLRYSATHRDAYNPLHILWPSEAYKKGLVKQVEVVSVVEDENIGEVEISLQNTVSKWQKITANIECFMEWKNGIPTKKVISIKCGDNLREKTGIALYEWWIVENIALSDDWGNAWYILFTNGTKISEWGHIGWEKVELLSLQIETTIREHFLKREFLRKNNIKPLSLLFIDTVANYVNDDGVIKKLFLEALSKENEKRWKPIEDIEKAHSGYFSKKKEKGGVEIFIDSIEWRDSANDKDTYDLIMKDKERLLSMSEPVEFIFSHSALREWWDNPNVFTLATLRESASIVKMRQELGRGMRLCVNGDWVRIRTLPDGKNPNILTVIPTMSYKNFALTLQWEYNDAGYKDAPIPEDAKKRKSVKRKKDYKNDPLLIALWGKISKQSIYSLSLESEKMIREIVKRINDFEGINYQKKAYTVGERTRLTEIWKEVSGDIKWVGSRVVTLENRTIENPIEQIEKKTGLSRKSIGSILLSLKNREYYTRNPEKYICDIINIINQVKDRLSIEEITYSATGEKYSIERFSEEVLSYEDRILDITGEKQIKTLYDGIIYDSDVERDFAENLISSPYIRYFLKLPDWFKIATPVLWWEAYNPDWAILASRDGTDSDMKLYFVIETKSSMNEDERRWTENQKIECGKRHFQAIDESLKYIPLWDKDWGKIFEMLKNYIIG